MTSRFSAVALLVVSALVVTAVAGCGLKHDPALVLRPAAEGRELPAPIPAGATQASFSGGRALHVTWVDSDGAMRSATWSGDWSAPVGVSAHAAADARAGREATVVERADGTLLARWFDGEGASEAARLAISSSAGASWSTPIVLSHDVGLGNEPFAWVDTAKPFPVAAWIAPVQNDEGSLENGLVHALPDAQGRYSEPKRIQRVVAPNAVSGAGSGRSDSFLIAARPIRTPPTSAVHAGARSFVEVYRVGIDGTPVTTSYVRGDESAALGAPRADPGPVVASRGDEVAVAWIAVGPADHRIHAAISRSDGRTFPFAVQWFGPGVERARDLSLAFLDEKRVLIAWSAGDAIEASLLDVTTHAAGPVVALTPRIRDRVELRWVGVAAGRTFVVWRGVDRRHHLLRLD